MNSLASRVKINSGQITQLVAEKLSSAFAHWKYIFWDDNKGYTLGLLVSVEVDPEISPVNICMDRKKYEFNFCEMMFYLINFSFVMVLFKLLVVMAWFINLPVVLN